MGTWLIDAVIGFTLIEAALLLGYRRFTRRGLPAREYAANLVSGLCLMLALRAALVGSHWGVVGAWLAASGLVHGYDLWRRWPR